MEAGGFLRIIVLSNITECRCVQWGLKGNAIYHFSPVFSVAVFCGTGVGNGKKYRHCPTKNENAVRSSVCIWVMM